MHNKFLVWEKTITIRKKKDFISGSSIIFSVFFGLVMCYESQTWRPMAIGKMYVIYFMHIDFFQFFSSNHWIKFNFDLNELWVPKFCLTHFKVFFNV
jgi:hypothetical protein